jgi:sporulation protein YlmC with PRC-barrel domain
MQTFKLFKGNQAREVSGYAVVDNRGESIGKVDGLWIDPSTDGVEFVGVQDGGSAKVHVVPAVEIQMAENDATLRIQYPANFIRKAPKFAPGDELSEIQKQEINTYFGRTVALQRVTSIEETRPEQAIQSLPLTEEQSRDSGLTPPEDRLDIERAEQAFFNQEGSVTDTMGEVDAGPELRRSQEEAKARNREDRIKLGLSD